MMLRKIGSRDREEGLHGVEEFSDFGLWPKSASEALSGAR